MLIPGPCGDTANLVTLKKILMPKNKCQKTNLINQSQNTFIGLMLVIRRDKSYSRTTMSVLELSD